jgi:bacteriorhodopsin
MGTAWMDPQFVLDFYQACLTVLVWLLAAFACLGILAWVIMLFVECNPFPRSARRATEPASEISAQG